MLAVELVDGRCPRGLCLAVVNNIYSRLNGKQTTHYSQRKSASYLFLRPAALELRWYTTALGTALTLVSHASLNVNSLGTQALVERDLRQL